MFFEGTYRIRKKIKEGGALFYGTDKRPKVCYHLSFIRVAWFKIMCTCLSPFPPKYSVAEIIGYIKGKSAIAVARQFGDKKKNFNGEKLWARGYAVSTVGFEEAQIHSYIKHQEQLHGPGSNEPSDF